MKICFGCYEISDSGDKCAICGTDVPLDYQGQLENAANTFQLGVVYRSLYEDQFRRSGKIGDRYSLFDPDTWATFLSAAVIGGIAGNLAYDALKALALKIVSRATAQGESGLSRTIEKHCGGNVEIVIEYIREYQDGLPNVDPAVRKAIEEEELADLMGKTVEELTIETQAREGRMPTAAEMTEATLKAMRKHSASKIQSS